MAMVPTLCTPSPSSFNSRMQSSTTRPPTQPSYQRSRGRGRGRGRGKDRGTSAPSSTIICYECRELGHRRYAYPKLATPITGSTPQPLQRERVHAVIEPDPGATESLIEGMIRICGRDMYTLIDAGSTLSFISGGMVDALKLLPVRASTFLMLSTAAGDRIYPNLVCENCILEIMGYEMSVTLRVLEFLEFDALLGMDWLAAYHAHLDCFAKEVIFHIPSYPSFTYKGSASDKQITRGRLATSEEIEVLASMVLEEEEASEIKLEDISVVIEYPKVFPTELPGLPPKREIDFLIELIPKTKPISIPPYRMAPKELKELKTQLEEFLEKGFIRPSMSPWGAPVFL